MTSRARMAPAEDGARGHAEEGDLGGIGEELLTWSNGCSLQSA
jgi:hypothetical protein